MTMWRRLGALLCISCQYRAARAMRMGDLDDYTEGLLTEMGIDTKEYSDWLSSPAGLAAKAFASDLIKNPIGTGGGSSGDDAETCDVCSGMGSGLGTQ